MKLGILCMALGTRMDGPQDAYRKTTVVVVVVVAFTLNRSFYSTTSGVHPVSVLILHAREIFCGDRLRKQRKNKQNNRELLKEGRQIKCQRTGDESIRTWVI